MRHRSWRSWWLITAFFVLCGLCACGESDSAPNINPMDPAPDFTLPATPFPGPDLTDSPQLTVVPEEEPPLSEAEIGIPVPEFLDAEQQLLYRRAHSLYHIFHGWTIGADSYPVFPETTAPSAYDEVELDGQIYLIAHGRYQNWADFEAVILAAFTQELFDEWNRTPPVFREHEGWLCFIDAAMGSDPDYYGSQMDTFELISMTDAEIKFYVIGHYQRYNSENTSHVGAARETGLDDGDDFTKASPVTMLRTEDGWRFSGYELPT